MTPRLSLVLVLSAFAACAPKPFYASRDWPKADELFRSDPRWRGGDGAYSIGLGNERVLWLFGDTFIKESGTGGRDGSVMIRNSAAIQEGLDPSSATMRFHWGGSVGKPADYFAAAPGEWLWPGHGVRLGRKLLVFMLRIRAKGDGVFGFEPFGWSADLVENPDEPLPRWNLRRLDAPEGPGLCSGALLEWEGHVYAYCPNEPEHRVYLARWETARAASGDLSAPRWWTGKDWNTDGSPAPVFDDGQVELTVHYDAALKRFVETQSVGFGDAILALRFSPRPEGPWSKPESVYRPPESGRKEALVYAGKAHPPLSGMDLILTYASNAWEPKVLMADESLYYPRFVQLRRAPRR